MANQRHRKVYMMLRLKGRDLDPIEITHAFQLSPTHSFRRGDMFRAGGRDHARAYGMWMLSTEESVQSEELTQHCKRLLEWIGNLRSQIQKYRSQEGVDVTIGFWWEPTD